MSFPFSRFLNVACRISVIGAGLPAALIFDSVRTEGHYMSWSIEKTITPEPDTATCSIYNIDPRHRKMFESNAVSANLPYKVKIEIGWDKAVRQVYFGEMKTSKSFNQVGVDDVTILDSAEIVSGYQDSVLDQNFTNTGFIPLLKILVSGIPPNGLGMIFPPSTEAKIRTFAGATASKVFKNIHVGEEPKTIITSLMHSIGLSWTVQNGVFLAVADGLIEKPIVPKLDYSQGLLEIIRKDDGGAEILAQANPEITPGCQIVVYEFPEDAPKAETFRVVSTSFTGFNRQGAQSLMNITCRSAQISL